MSRLRRPFLSDRFFFVTCNLARRRQKLTEDDFARLAEVIQSLREEHKFFLTAWVFLPDHWHAIVFPRHPLTISRVMEVIKVQSTVKVNLRRKTDSRLWQARFFDRAVRTVKEYHECVDYIHLNPVSRGLVERPEEWRWSSFASYSDRPAAILPVDVIRLPADQNTRL